MLEPIDRLSLLSLAGPTPRCRGADPLLNYFDIYLGAHKEEREIEREWEGNRSEVREYIGFLTFHFDGKEGERRGFTFHWCWPRRGFGSNSTSYISRNFAFAGGILFLLYLVIGWWAFTHSAPEKGSFFFLSLRSLLDSVSCFVLFKEKGFVRGLGCANCHSLLERVFLVDFIRNVFASASQLNLIPQLLVSLFFLTFFIPTESDFCFPWWRLNVSHFSCCILDQCRVSLV